MRPVNLRMACLVSSIFLVVSCSEENDATFSTSTDTEIASCKEACNQLKFFECNDSAQHALCFEHCELAPGSEIERFTACVVTDICDPTCGTYIEPPEDKKPDPTTQPTASSCTELCNSFVADCVPGIDPNLLCAEACTPDEAALTSYCLSRRSACDVPPECQDTEDDESAACVAACEAEGFFQCIAPGDVAGCISTCGTADPSARDTFTACSKSAAGQCSGCYAKLDPSVRPSVNVEACQAACDQLAFFECIGTDAQTTCRDACAAATNASQVDNFVACTQGLCTDGQCVELLGDAPAPTTCPDVPCGANEQCVDGACVPKTPTTCPEVPCASNQTCQSGVCIDNTQPTECPDVPCASGQICQLGECVARPAMCQVRLDGSDGCDHDELCLFSDVEETECARFEDCRADGSCPVGVFGAVCNIDMIPGKSRVCMTGLCTGHEHCPDQWRCVHLGVGSSLGQCSSGTQYDICNSNEDCLSGLTCSPVFDDACHRRCQTNLVFAYTRKDRVKDFLRM